MHRSLTSLLIALTLSLACLSSVNATVTLPALISDNMVMQRNAPVHLWGKASAGEKVTIKILGQEFVTFPGTDGKWECWLKPMQSTKPVTMTVQGTNTLTVSNILLGEVWVASGQSNMEWDVSQSNDAEKEIASANYPGIRIFEQAKSFSDTLKSEATGKWVVCSPATIPHITAAGYFFARGIHKKIKVPVGLIENAWGATNCQAWTPIEAIRADARLKYVETDWNNAQPTNKNKPAAIYNAVIAPLSKYTIKGVIWYQGEANAYVRVSYPYRYLFPAMIQGWRTAWKQGDFPFIFVQLSTLFKHPYWPVLRESQTESLQLRNTAMAVTYDIGDSTDAHYHNKQDVGYRLELAARRLVYGENIEDSGPVFRQATYENSAIRLWFDHAAGMKPNTGQQLTGFVIAGADGKFVPAAARIDGTTILVSSPQVTKPLHARYAFQDAVVANLVNGAGLPGVPFRTDMKDGL